MGYVSTFPLSDTQSVPGTCVSWEINECRVSAVPLPQYPVLYIRAWTQFTNREIQAETDLF